MKPVKNILTPIFVAAILCSLGCGVKGRPQAPLKPALISRGEPSFSKATEKIKVSPQNKKKKIEGDFEDQYDFEPDGEEKK